MTVCTLEHVYLLLPEIYSASSATAYETAFRKFARLTGRRLSQIPATETEIVSCAGKIVWAGKFPRAKTLAAQERAFHTLVGKVRSATKAALERDTQGAPDTGIAAAWDRLAAYAEEVENTFDDAGRRRLPNGASLSVANLRARLGDTHPAAVDTAAAARALKDIPADKTNSYRNSVRFLDKLIATRESHAPIADLLPGTPIGALPTIRDAALDWSRFTAAFRADRDRAITRAIRGTPRKDQFRGALGDDPIAERRATARRRKRPVRNAEARQKSFMAALSWLARHAFADRAEAYPLTALRGLLTEDAVEAAVARFKVRAAASDHLGDVQSTASLATWLADLQTLAERNDYPEEVIWALEDLRFDPDNYSDHTGEMSATRAAFVKLIDRDPAIVRAIVTGPRKLLGEWRRAAARWDSLSVHQQTEALHLLLAAALLALQLARPLRTRNLNDMLSDGEDAEIAAPRHAGTSAWLDIGRARVKNRRPIEGPIPDPIWAVIATWLDEGRDKWSARFIEAARDMCAASEVEAAVAGLTAAFEANDFLVPSQTGRGPTCRQTLNRAWNRGMARLGLAGLTPHVMRHVDATIYLARHPGDYPVVAALLCDSLRTVEKFYARGEGRAAMELFAQVLEELDPTLNLRGAA